MQTFLPYSSFVNSAAVLDRQRLGKQRVENLQIMKALRDPSYGWQNHPAVRMWRGHELSLYHYQEAICFEWRAVRGYKDTCLDKTNAVLGTIGLDQMSTPPWLGDEEFHRSHQSNLIRKWPEFYQPLFPDTPADLEYLWPV